LVEKREENKELGRPRSRLDDNNQIDLKETGWTKFTWPRIGTSGGLL
jgi:hypothetical protein